MWTCDTCSKNNWDDATECHSCDDPRWDIPATTPPATLILLHGVGAGGISGAWRTALDANLSACGYRALSDNEVLAPRYSAYLNEQPPRSAPLPASTRSAPNKEVLGRYVRQYYRRQFALELLLDIDRVHTNVFDVPQTLFAIALRFIGEARRYFDNEGLRGCVLRHIIDTLPIKGEVVLVGHSLGSLIALDILNRLPPQLLVRRLVTIGSPAGHVAMHHPERLLETFPFDRVQSWINVWSIGDMVPFGKGIAQLFPAALDIQTDLGLGKHAAEYYLAHPLVGTAIGEAMFGSLSRELVPTSRAIDRRLEEWEAVIVAGIAYGHLLADELGSSDRDTRKRFRGALREVQCGVINALARQYKERQQEMPQRLAALRDGSRPEPGFLLDFAESIPALLSIAANNVIAPFEIDVSEDARRQAIVNLSVLLEFPRARGTAIFEALQAARETVIPGGLSKRFLALTGLLLIAAVPVGLLIAAPAGLAGGAAIVGALAGFGPGGMVGGLITSGLMASAGAGATVAALASPSATPETVEAVVVHQLAVVIARAALREQGDHGPWFTISRLESEIAHELQKVRRYSTGKAPGVAALERKAAAIRRAVQYMVDHGLAPTIAVKES